MPMQRKKRANKNNLSASRPLKILVADEHTITRKMIKRMLFNYGYDCETVIDGVEMIEKVKEKEFDIIFMDLHLPRAGGLEACKLIRTSLTTQPQPLIVGLISTNVLAPTEKQGCLEVGVDEFLSKPVELGALHQVLIHLAARIYGPT